MTHFTQTFALHRMRQNGETRQDVHALIVGTVHAPQIEVTAVRIREATAGDMIRVTAEGFGNDAEVEDHRNRFRAIGAHVT